MYLFDVCLFVCLFVFLTIYGNVIHAENELKECCCCKTVNFLLKATIRGVLVESPEVFNVLRLWQGFSLFRLKFVVAKSDYPRYHIGSFPIWP